MSASLNESEILDMIRSVAGPRNGGGFTRSELQEIMQCGPARALSAIKKMMKGGHVRPVMLDRVNSHGQQNRVKGYELTDSE